MLPDQMEGDDEEDIDGGDDEQPRPEGRVRRCRLDLDAVDRRQAPDEAEDEEEVVGPKT